MCDKQKLYHSLIEQLEQIQLFDCAASCAIDFDCKTVPNTITEILKSSDKTRAMLLIGCAEKYKNEMASEYELFAEWERIMPLCIGTGSAALYAEEKRLLGIDTAQTPQDAWKVGNKRLWEQSPVQKPEKAIIHLKRFVSNIVKEKDIRSLSYGEVSDCLSKEIKQQKNKGIHLIFDGFFGAFQAPNIYCATLYWEKKKSAEKLNEEEELVLLSQLLIDGLLAFGKKNDPLPILHLRDWQTLSQLENLIDYLAAHHLLVGELRIGIGLDTDIEPIADLCQSLSSYIPVYPELILRPSDFGTDIAERLRSLASVYPLAGLRFGGVNTDAPLYVAGHRLFKKALARLLSDLCDTEEQAMGVVKCMLENGD